MPTHGLPRPRAHDAARSPRWPSDVFYVWCHDRFVAQQRRAAQGRAYEPREIRVVTPLDWWRALPANTAHEYEERVTELIAALCPATRVTHTAMGAARVRVELPSSAARRGADDDDAREALRARLSELAEAVWEHVTRAA